MARGGSLLVQGSIGRKGNFEVVIPRVGGGFVAFWRENDAPGLPWHGPGLAMGSEDDVTDVALLEDGLLPPQLASVRREGSRLRFAVRSSQNAHGVVHRRWGPSAELPGGGVVGGAPGLVQSVAHGNFEVVAP